MSSLACPILLRYPLTVLLFRVSVYDEVKLPTLIGLFNVAPTGWASKRMADISKKVKVRIDFGK